MKRIFAALSAALVLFSITGCGGPAAPDASAGASAPAAPAQSSPAAPAEGPALETLIEQERQAAEQARQQRIRDYMDTMTLEEKVGQLFFVRCPAENAVEDISTYHLGGYLLFARDYKNGETWLTKEQLVEKLRRYQDAADIPLFIGSDEEGGSVTRASRNPNLFAEKFKSPQAVAKAAHDHGNVFAEDARERSNALLALGINVNFAPVCDVSTDPADFIYDRTLGQNADATAAFVADTVSAMKDAGIASVLKHFPGYGSNEDTHTGIAVDDRAYEEFINCDFLPFQAGVEAGAPFVLVSHNIVECMDADLPASLSPEVHRVLREECGFAGLAITDDLAMDAVKAYAENGSVAELALAAGNDMLVTSDYRSQIPAVIEAVQNSTIPERVINDACYNVLDYKDRFLSIPAISSVLE